VTDAAPLADAISLKGLAFYGYHGVLDEERRIGQRFVVDVRLSLDLSVAGREDRLTATIDYASAWRAIRDVIEGPPLNLIEAVAERVAAALLAQFPLLSAAWVRIVKPGAPVAGASSGAISVEVARERGRTSSANATASTEVTGAPRGERGGPKGAIGAATIRRLLQGDPPMIGGLGDTEQQIQPNGVDLRLESVWALTSPGTIGVTDEERIISERRELAPVDDIYALAPAPYVIRMIETVSLPTTLMAFGRSRSSLLRCGVAIHTAVWDAGYSGRSEALLVVYNPGGFSVRRGARVLQLVFVSLDAPTSPYGGRYQGENTHEPVRSP